MQDGTQKSQKVFMNIPTEVGATEAEAIGEPCLPAMHGPTSLAAPVSVLEGICTSSW